MPKYTIRPAQSVEISNGILETFRAYARDLGFTKDRRAVELALMKAIQHDVLKEAIEEFKEGREVTCDPIPEKLTSDTEMEALIAKRNPPRRIK